MSPRTALLAFLPTATLLAGATFGAHRALAQAQQAPVASKSIVVEAGPATADTLRLVPPIGHTDHIDDIQVTLDGRRALSASWDGTVRVWDLATGREIRAYMGHAGGGHRQVYSAAIHPNGRLVATGSNLGIRVWEVETGREVAQFDSTSPSAMRFLPDGRLFVFTASRYWAGIYDLTTGKRVKEFPAAKYTDKGDLTADGTQVALGYGNFADKAHSGTVHLCDVATSAVLQTLEHPEPVLVIRYSPDGKRLATADLRNTLRLWDTATGKLLHTLTGYRDNLTGNVTTLGFTTNGKQLLSGGATVNERGEVWIWDVATGAQLRGLKAHSQQVTGMALHPDGKRVVTASEDQSLSFWHLNTGIVERRMGGSMEHAVGAQPSLDGNRILTAISHSPEAGLVKGSLRLWDLRSGRVLRNFTNASQILAWAFSPNGKLVAAAGHQELNVWDAETGKPVFQTKPTGGLFCRSLAFSPDSKRLAAGVDSTLCLYDLTTRTEVRQQKGLFNIVAFSPDGTLLAGTGDREAVITRADTGAEIRRLPFIEQGTLAGARGLAFSRDGKTLGATGSFMKFHLFDVATGALRTTTAPSSGTDYGNYHTLSAGPDGGFVFSGVAGVDLFDAQGKLVRTLDHRQEVKDAQYLADRRVISVTLDGTLRIWEPQTGTQAFSYLPLLNNNWLAIAPDGRFDGSPEGIGRCYFARGTQTYDLDQFAEQFRAPGLVGAILAIQPGAALPVAMAPAPNAATAVAAGAPPRVAIASPKPGPIAMGSVEVVVEVTEQNGGGVGGVRLYHNDRLVAGSTGLRGIEVLAPTPAPIPQPAANGEVLTKRFTVGLTPGENVLRAVALSRTGLESGPAEIRLTFKPAAPTPAAKPNLHIFVVGVNTYRDSALDLTYARPDAESIARFFEGSTAAKTLFGGTKVTRLLDAAATGPAIRQGLTALATATKPDDVVFLYFAGHGETAPATEVPNAPETFFFLPTEMRQIALKERVRELGISGGEIEQAIGKMAARKIVLVYDACKSGGAVGGLRGAADEQAALGALARAQGIHILTAATSQQYASEVKELGHGILTYALLEGLQGKAARTGNPAVYVRELMSYVEDRVPELARQYRGREQWPVPFGRGQNFPVALGAAGK